jgi:hypothetical protein
MANKNEIDMLKRYLHTNIYCSASQQQARLWMTYMSIKKWKTEQGYALNGMLFSLKEEENLVIYNNMGEPGG